MPSNMTSEENKKEKLDSNPPSPAKVSEGNLGGQATQKEEKLEYLKREEIRTMEKDVKKLREVEAEKEEAAKKAVAWIKDITREVKVGEIFQGKVKKILDFGAFVEILPGQEGLIHISELAPWRVEKVEDIVKVGDTVPVKVISIDEQGRINLSLKKAKKDYARRK